MNKIWKPYFICLHLLQGKTDANFERIAERIIDGIETKYPDGYETDEKKKISKIGKKAAKEEEGKE